MNKSGTASQTLYFGNGEEVYPCRCGQVHRGNYAVEDWNHHNCLHKEPLFRLPLVGKRWQAICMECGQMFQVN